MGTGKYKAKWDINLHSHHTKSILPTIAWRRAEDILSTVLGSISIQLVKEFQPKVLIRKCFHPSFLEVQEWGEGERILKWEPPHLRNVPGRPPGNDNKTYFMDQPCCKRNFSTQISTAQSPGGKSTELSSLLFLPLYCEPWAKSLPKSQDSWWQPHAAHRALCFLRSPVWVCTVYWAVIVSF